MKNGKGKRIALFGLAMLLALLMPVVCAAQGIDYETLRYDVDVVISEQNAYAVTETITVDFKSPAHGIYRYITTGGDLYYVDEQGNLKTANGKLHISNIDTGGVTLKKSYENDNVVLRLGDADITLTGEYTYTIRYIAEMYDDGTDAFDHVYWDLIPAEWQSPIREASFRVELPKDFDDSTLEWISGPTGSGTTGEVEWTRSGNAVSGTLLRPLDAYEGVTVRIVLPDGYFTGVRSDTWMGIAGGFASLISALIALLLFKRYGKDRKIVPVVEFYPPDDLSPAEVGYILNGKADVKDILSLVPYLAHKGYMDIRRLEPKKRLIGKDVERFEMHKIKDLPSSAPLYQRTFFDGLFAEGNPIATDEVSEEFGSKFQSAQQMLAAHFTLNKDKRIYETSSLFATGAGCLLMLVPFVAGMIVVGTAVLAPKLMQVVGYLMFGSFLVSLFSTIFMRKRSEYSSKLLGRLYGFRNFIKTAELDRIKLLVDQDPEYFYNILPYAYVFDLTDVWMKHFEGLNIKPASWYAGGDMGVMPMVYLANSLNALQASIPTSPPASSSSFSGGGSGGGGFSGGGGGGGGGGAW